VKDEKERRLRISISEYAIGILSSKYEHGVQSVTSRCTRAVSCLSATKTATVLRNNVR